MKILYITTTDLSGEFSSIGSVRHVMEVSENLQRLGHDMRLIVAGYGAYPEKTSLDVSYVPTINIRFLRTILLELLFPLWITVAMLRFRPDAIYWRQSYMTCMPALLARLFGRPIVTEVNGFTADEVESETISWLRKRLVLGFERANYHLATHLICVSPMIASKVIHRYRLPEARVSSILNGVNADRCRPLVRDECRRELGVEEGTQVVGFVGHFFPWDGLEVLIRAAPAIIRKSRKKVLFWIIGHGKWGVHLQQMCEQEGVADQFHFAGKVQWDELIHHLNIFDVGVAPYAMQINANSGRSSLKLLEYFAIGIPCVVSDFDVIPEIALLKEKQLGIAVAPDDPDALAAAVCRLLDDDDLCREMGRKGRDIVLSEHSWLKVAERTQDVLLGLVRQQKGGG